MVALLDHVVNRADAWMIQSGGRARFAENASQGIVPWSRFDHLERHGSLQARVGRSIDGAHAAGAKGRYDREPAELIARNGIEKDEV